MARHIINKAGRILSLALIALIAAFGAWLIFLVEPVSFGQTYNASALVNTTLNITNSAPMVSNVLLDTPINLVAGYNKTVYCNATIFDWDNQTLRVNATLFLIGNSTPNSTDRGNSHYTNSSCSRATPQGREMNYTCAFEVRYYAINSTSWSCNVTAADTYSAFTSNRSNNATITPLVAISIPSLLDYGDLMVNQISNDTLANVTNVGNRHANISVEGYGSVPGDGLSFVCDYGNIAINSEKYHANVNQTYVSMVSLTGTTTMLSNFYVPLRTNDNAESTNFTYWKVQIPVGAGGRCNGKILFTASDKSG